MYLFILGAEGLPRSRQLPSKLLFAGFWFAGQSLHYAWPLFLTELEKWIGWSLRGVRIGFSAFSFRSLLWLLFFRIVNTGFGASLLLRSRLIDAVLLENSHRDFAPSIAVLIQAID